MGRSSRNRSTHASAPAAEAAGADSAAATIDSPVTHHAASANTAPTLTTPAEPTKDAADTATPTTQHTILLKTLEEAIQGLETTQKARHKHQHLKSISTAINQANKKDCETQLALLERLSRHSPQLENDDQSAIAILRCVNQLIDNLEQLFRQNPNIAEHIKASEQVTVLNMLLRSPKPSITALAIAFFSLLSKTPQGRALILSTPHSLSSLFSYLQRALKDGADLEQPIETFKALLINDSMTDCDHIQQRLSGQFVPFLGVLLTKNLREQENALALLNALTRSFAGRQEILAHQNILTTLSLWISRPPSTCLQILTFHCLTNLARTPEVCEQLLSSSPDMIERTVSILLSTEEAFLQRSVLFFLGCLAILPNARSAIALLPNFIPFLIEKLQRGQTRDCDPILFILVKLTLAPCVCDQLSNKPNIIKNLLSYLTASSQGSDQLATHAALILCCLTAKAIPPKTRECIITHPNILQNCFDMLLTPSLANAKDHVSALMRYLVGDPEIALRLKTNTLFLSLIKTLGAEGQMLLDDTTAQATDSACSAAAEADRPLSHAEVSQLLRAICHSKNTDAVKAPALEKLNRLAQTAVGQTQIANNPVEMHILIASLRDGTQHIKIDIQSLLSTLLRDPSAALLPYLCNIVDHLKKIEDISQDTETRQIIQRLLSLPACAPDHSATLNGATALCFSRTQSAAEVCPASTLQ